MINAYAADLAEQLNSEEADKTIANLEESICRLYQLGLKHGQVQLLLSSINDNAPDIWNDPDCSPLN